jgi:mannosyltransferase OCH1-like enzyme
MLGNYKHFIEFIKDYKDDGSIPQIIYRTGPFKFEDIPSQILDIYQKDLNNNPKYSLFYFDDVDCEHFISDNYGIDILQIYNTLIPSAFKADLFRYMILYKFGGVWMDFSMSLNYKLSDLISNFKQIYVRDRIHLLHGGWQKNVSIYQGFICTIKQTDLLKMALERSLKNVRDRNLTLSCLGVTGPIMFGMVYRDLKIDGTKDNETMKIGFINQDVYVYQFEYEYDNVILDNGKPIINIKHPNHQNLLYNNKDHYGELWNQQKVFKNG